MAVPQRGSHINNPGRDAGMIVAAYQFGETKVFICNDHISTDQDELDRIDREIATAAWACVQDAANKNDEEA